MKNPSFSVFQNIIRKGNFSIICFLISVSFSIAQNRKDLEEIRFEIIKEIDQTNKLLEETAANKKAVLSDLQMINSQMSNRTKLVQQINKELQLMDQELKQKEEIINLSEISIDSLQEQYDLVLRAMYREKLTRNPLIEFFSDNLWQSIFLRNNYYNQLKQYLNNKLIQIAQEKASLSNEILALNIEKSKKQAYQNEITLQNKLLESEQEKQESLIASLKEDEQSLEAALNEQKKERERMNVAIEQVINSRFGQEENLPIEEILTFKERKGSLRWPVENGVISSQFGTKPHPTLKNITISNNGIDIRALNGSDAIAIAGGKVVGITKVAGYGIMIIIKHNQYFTVYSKLAEVIVQNGENISEGQKLGTLSTKNGVSELHFEVWNNDKSENPEKWLKK